MSPIAGSPGQWSRPPPRQGDPLSSGLAFRGESGLCCQRRHGTRQTPGIQIAVSCAPASASISPVAGPGAHATQAASGACAVHSPALGTGLGLPPGEVGEPQAQEAPGLTHRLFRVVSGCRELKPASVCLMGSRAPPPAIKTPRVSGKANPDTPWNLQDPKRLNGLGAPRAHTPQGLYSRPLGTFSPHLD